MSAAKKRRSGRSSSSRHREPRHVAPVLDPNWQSPYVPSLSEREHNARAIRTISLRRARPLLYIAIAVFSLSVVLALASIWVNSLASWWWPLGGLVLVGCVLGVTHMRSRALEANVNTLASTLTGAFSPGGRPIDMARLSTIVDRLSATFGLNDVACRIIDDETYNAALLPGSESLTLLVTSGLLADFELIEIEGVVAHLMARQRLGLLERLSAASMSKLSFADAHELAGVAVAYRADEVAAAGIRYPQGLAEALDKCASQPIAKSSFFASDRYGATRWVWFNQFADRPSSLPGDLDDPRVRARALAEW